MSRIFVTSKLHRATVTASDLRSRGSISLPQEIMDAMGLAKYEFVHVNSLANGHHWETFVLPGLPGQITMHGPPSIHFHPGDRIVVNRLEHAESKDIPFMEHRCVEVDDNNNVMRVLTDPICNGLD